MWSRIMLIIIDPHRRSAGSLQTLNTRLHITIGIQQDGQAVSVPALIREEALSTCRTKVNDGCAGRLGELRRLARRRGGLVCWSTIRQIAGDPPLMKISLRPALKMSTCR